MKKTERALIHSLVLGVWMGLFLFALVPSSSSDASEERFDGKERIAESLCQSGAFDFTARFPEEGNQGSQGQCFAFAATGLLDEHTCVLQSSRCGVRYSPIDAARDYPDKVAMGFGAGPSDRYWDRNFFNLGNLNQGGSTYDLLEAALRFGVCEEKYAPWFPILEKKCRGLQDRSACVIGGLKRQWRKYHRLTRNWSSNDEVGCYVNAEGQPISSREAEKLESLLDATGAYLDGVIDDPEGWGSYSQSKLLALMQESPSEYEFIERVLIPESCEQNRAEFTGSEWRERWTEDLVWSKQSTRPLPNGSHVTTQTETERTHKSLLSNPERMERLLARVKESQRSVSLALCSKSALGSSKDRRDDPRVKESCGPHALIANGLRWNSTKKRCEIHIRNSWGPKTSLRGWLPVEPVLNSVFEISGIAPD